jgi:MATE family multidrug resistance protein
MAFTPHAGADGHVPTSLCTEVRLLLPLALPIMGSSLLTFLMSLVDLFMVGHLGADELAAAGLANSYFMILQHPVFGFATALDTILSQAYGAKRYDSYGQWSQIGLFLLMLLTIPYVVLLTLTEPILLTAGFHAPLATRAAEFCRLLIPGVVPHVAFQVALKFLQSQSIVAPAVYVALIANVCNALANWLFIYALGLGFRGAPLATSLSRWVQLLLLVGYVAYRRRGSLSVTLPRRRVPWRDAPRMVRTFVWLGAPGALMLGSEAWFFEVSNLLAASLGTVPFDAHVVLMNVVTFTFLACPFALGIACSIRVGQLLGHGDHARAKRTAWAKHGSHSARPPTACSALFSLTIAALLVLQVGSHLARARRHGCPRHHKDRGSSADRAYLFAGRTRHCAGRTPRAHRRALSAL